MDDGILLDMFINRDESAIVEARLKYGVRLFMTAKNILRNAEDAEECVSDALFRAWQSIPPNRPQMLGAYLMKITRNQSFNRWEAKNAAKRGGGGVDAMLDELGDCIPSSVNTERAYEASLVTMAINGFLAKTDKTARVAFVLRYFHGESISDICKRFNMREGKVKSMLFRLRKRLRVHLEKEGINI